MQKIMVTGATGFIGQAVVQALLAQKYRLSIAVRNLSPTLPESVTQIKITDIASLAENSSALQDIDVLIHIAGRAHIMDKTENDPLAEFRRVNTTATLKLANLAESSGVKRFIFISSIKVNGEASLPGNPFKPELGSPPADAYGLSKFEAEHGLLSIAHSTRMQVVIIRPPLVYGPGVKANFATLIKWLNKGIPLPFGAIKNKRSLVALDNLVSFIMLCISHPKAANEIFLLADETDVSTTELLQKIAHALHVRAWLLPVPVALMTFFARLIARQDLAERLFGSLQVDSSKAKNLLGWQAVTTMDEQLRKIAEDYH